MTVQLEKNKVGEIQYYDDYFYILDLNTRKLVNHISFTEEEATEELKELEEKGGSYDLLQAVRYIVEK